MSRQKVLELLKSRPKDYLSGEEIAERLGLSRAAVWKAVDALRKEGYTIEARTSLGYRLTASPDALTEKEIRGFLGETMLVGKELICLESVDSTNTYLKKQALSGVPDGTVVTADCQTGGRGRMVFSGYIAGNLWDFLEYLAIAVGGLGMFCGGLKMDANMHRYARYLAVMGETEAVSLTALSRKLGWSEKRVEKDLEKMIDRGYFGGQAYLDRSLGYFFRSSQADAELKKQREAQSAAQEPPKETEEGYSGILRNIRRANDRIADPVLTAKIDRLEDITARIFRAVEEDPKKRSRIDTFLNYYLPTTQKLLDAYAEFDAAGVEGENLRQAKQRIEKTMDSIVEGFEHQLDELYKTDAMDVDSDIRVMETMLHRDTASVEKDFGLGGSAQTAPKSTSAGDVDLGGTAAQMQEE